MDHGLHPPRVWLCMIDSAAEFETFETFAFRVFDVVGPKRDDSHDPQQRALIFDVLFSRGYQLWAKSEDWDLFLLWWQMNTALQTCLALSDASFYAEVLQFLFWSSWAMPTSESTTNLHKLKVRIQKENSRGIAYLDLDVVSLLFLHCEPGPARFSRVDVSVSFVLVVCQFTQGGGPWQPTSIELRNEAGTIVVVLVASSVCMSIHQQKSESSHISHLMFWRRSWWQNFKQRAMSRPRRMSAKCRCCRRPQLCGTRDVFRPLSPGIVLVNLYLHST